MNVTALTLTANMGTKPGKTHAVAERIGKRSFLTVCGIVPDHANETRRPVNCKRCLAAQKGAK